jgi:hypothetical protein
MTTPCTVTATLNDTSAAALQGNAFVRFRLRNYSGFVPRVLGTAILVETQIDVVPNGSGLVTTQLWGNDNIDPGGGSNPPSTFYTVEYWNQGRITSQGNFSIIGASFNLGTAAQINPPPTPGGSGAASLLLEVNGVKNGSQTTLNLVAGSGIAITDNGSGTVTVGSGGAGTTLAAGSAVSVAGGNGAPSSASLNVSTEGALDWIACNQGPGASQAVYESTVPYTWKANGISRGKFQIAAIDIGDSVGQSVQINNLTVSPLHITANASDPARPFTASPAIQCGFAAVQGSGHIGGGSSIRLWGTGSSHTYKFYVFINQPSVVAVTAHADDGTTSDAVLTATETNTGAIWSFSFTANIPASSSVTVTAVVTTNNGTFAGAGFQAVSVF